MLIKTYLLGSQNTTQNKVTRKIFLRCTEGHFRFPFIDTVRPKLAENSKIMLFRSKAVTLLSAIIVLGSLTLEAAAFLLPSSPSKGSTKKKRKPTEVVIQPQNMAVLDDFEKVVNYDYTDGCDDPCKPYKGRGGQCEACCLTTTCPPECTSNLCGVSSGG